MKIFDHDPSSSRRRPRMSYTDENQRNKRTNYSKPELSVKDLNFLQKFIASLLRFDNHLIIRLTTSSLAPLVYNHEKVVNFFEFRMWILDNQAEKMNELQTSYQNLIAGKRFLLFVDNVWVSNFERMKFIQTLTLHGKKGSKIVMTTCDTNLMDLPDPILLNILSKLPPSSLLSVKCVSKAFLALLRDPENTKFLFSKAEIFALLRTHEPRCWPRDLYIIDGTNPDELIPNSSMKLFSKLSIPKYTTFHQASSDWLTNLGIVNSCNGLLCVCSTPFNNPVYVCNPMTGEYILLPEPIQSIAEEEFLIMDRNLDGELHITSFVVSGFGFSPNTEEYKVMRILEVIDDDDERNIVAQVLTLGSDSSWRTTGSLDSYGDIGLHLKRRGYIELQNAPYKPSWPVYLNGRIHWICNRKSSTMFIDSFSVEFEEFQEIPPPPHFSEAQKRAVCNMRLGVLGGRLYVSDVTSYTEFELWVMKEEGDSVCWTKDLVINTLSLNIWPRGLFQPLKYFDNGDLLMFHPSNALVAYNPLEKRFRYFKIRGIDSDFELIPHVPSFIPMKDCVKMENDQVEILHVRDLEKRKWDWKEFDEFKLVEEDESAISDSYSRIVEDTLSFQQAITTRHWNDLH